MNNGDIVTSADATDGAPTWVGVVVGSSRPSAYCECRVSIHCLPRVGPAHFSRCCHNVRPLSGSESAGLAEALTGQKWSRDGAWLSRGDDKQKQPWAYVCVGRPESHPDGRWEWQIWTTDAIGTMATLGGRCATKEDAKAAASRAIITYTIRGRV